jgi:hypothetical protein
VLLAGGGQRLTLPVGPLYTHDRRILGFVISRADTGELAEAAAVLNRRLAAEELPVRVHDIWPLDRAAEATRPSSAACAAGSCCGSPHPDPR